MPSPPPGATSLQQGSANGATYARYSITGTSPGQIVADYQSALQAAGFTVQEQGAGGGGWGDWGGGEAGLTATNGSGFVNVQAGGQNNGPTYFEVCLGPTAGSVADCEDISNGPQRSGSQSNSRAS